MSSNTSHVAPGIKVINQYLVEGIGIFNTMQEAQDAANKAVFMERLKQIDFNEEFMYQTDRGVDVVNFCAIPAIIAASAAAIRECLKLPETQDDAPRTVPEPTYKLLTHASLHDMRVACIDAGIEFPLTINHVNMISLILRHDFTAIGYSSSGPYLVTPQEWAAAKA